jgi:hypothetical protein
MINYERNSRLVLLKRTYPKICDHGLSIRAMVRVGGRFPVLPARGQNPALRVPDWIRREQPRPVLLQQNGDDAVWKTGIFRNYPVAAKDRMNENMSMRTIKRMKILACVQAKK